MSTRYSDRDDDRPYEREPDRSGRPSDYAYGETSRRYGGGEMGRDYGARGGGREYGHGYERDYGARYGRGYDDDYERGRYGNSEPSRRYEERYNYPSGYRSGEIYG